ncbi:hypothetical protein LINPERHAP1_LOCUS30819, partial [Linum perenne]
TGLLLVAGRFSKSPFFSFSSTRCSEGNQWQPFILSARVLLRKSDEMRV